MGLLSLGESQFRLEYLFGQRVSIRIIARKSYVEISILVLIIIPRTSNKSNTITGNLPLKKIQDEVGRLEGWEVLKGRVEGLNVLF